MAHPRALPEARAHSVESGFFTRLITGTRAPRFRIFLSFEGWPLLSATYCESVIATFTVRSIRRPIHRLLGKPAEQSKKGDEGKIEEYRAAYLHKGALARIGVY